MVAGGDHYDTGFIDGESGAGGEAADQRAGEGLSFDEAAESASVDGDALIDQWDKTVDEVADGEGLSVFSYTRDAVASENANAGAPSTQEARDSLDQTDIQTAIIKMRSETREPHRPMSDWTDED